MLTICIYNHAGQFASDRSTCHIEHPGFISWLRIQHPEQFSSTAKRSQKPLGFLERNNTDLIAYSREITRRIQYGIPDIKQIIIKERDLAVLVSSCKLFDTFNPTCLSPFAFKYYVVAKRSRAQRSCHLRQKGAKTSGEHTEE